ncbi:hypothetical protein BC831DRAFT_306620 [Entophlyctis helioformis]|nr:hypothetical protein BC831DRAFT_306620 [Entophlyctis helioformis]
MGGGSKLPYAKWAWSSYSAWWPQARTPAGNTFLTVSILVASGVALFNWSAEKETRHSYPLYWIPSMLWAKEFHDPVSVAFWKEQLAKEGREWIEPIPSWWPFKKAVKNE